MSKQTCYYYDEQRNRCNCYVNENLNELLAENAKLRELAKLAIHDVCSECPHKKALRSCEGCNIHEKALYLGLEVE